MPRPKKTVRRVQARLSEKAWKNIDPKGIISQQVNEALEKIDEQEVQIAINECQHYRGIDPKNPNLVVCKKNKEEKSPSYYPKIDCQACKFYHVNLVTIKAEKSLKEDIEKLEKEHEKQEKDVSKDKTIEEGILKAISQLKQEYQAVNVPALLKEKTEELAAKLEKAVSKAKTTEEGYLKAISQLKQQHQDLEKKLTTTLALLEKKTEELAILPILQTDNEQLRDELSQYSKIESKAEHQNRVMEKPQVIERTVERTEKITFKAEVPPLKILFDKLNI